MVPTIPIPVSILSVRGSLALCLENSTNRSPSTWKIVLKCKVVLRFSKILYLHIDAYSIEFTFFECEIIHWGSGDKLSIFIQSLGFIHFLKYTFHTDIWMGFGIYLIDIYWSILKQYLIVQSAALRESKGLSEIRTLGGVCISTRRSCWYRDEFVSRLNFESREPRASFTHFNKCNKYLHLLLS